MADRDRDAPSLPSTGKGWLIWLLAALAGALLGYCAHWLIHRTVHAVT